MRWRSVWDSNPRHGLLSRTTVFRTAPFIHSGNAPDMDTVRRRGNTVSIYISQKEQSSCRYLIFSPCRYRGLPCRIRTCGLLHPKQTRCQTALMVEVAPQVGLEPTTTRLTAEGSAIELLWNVVRPEGFEPSTSGIEARCSVH